MTETGARHLVTEAVERIAREATKNHDAWDLLARLTDDIGPRPAGSPQAEAAVAWAEDALTTRGVRCWREDVTVPHWVRGDASARVVAEHGQALSLLALGGSIPTPHEGITAEVVMVRSLEEIDAAGEELRGRIVLMNRAMNMDLVRAQRAFEAYREVNPLRVRGPARAARQGAVAFLIRSLGTASWKLPHAGTQLYEDGAPSIPAASIAAEDAEYIERLLRRGPVRIELRLSPSQLPDKLSSNVVGEVQGRDGGDEIIVIGAHLDSWDVSPGAHDNGAGVVNVIETLRLLSRDDLRPRRTIRGVLFMNEENGGHGGIAYHAAHRHENVIAVAETDHGAAPPIGFDSTLPPEKVRALDPLMEKLESLGVLAPAGGRSARIEQHAATGVDTAHFRADGVPGFGLMPESLHYFDLHHTAADTLDKVDPDHLARGIATFASLIWYLGEMGVPDSEP